MAGVAVFVIVGTGLAAGLSGGLVASTSVKLNASLDQAANVAANRAAMTGYDALAALPSTAEVELRVGERELTALREVELRPETRTARVTITAGAYTSGNSDFVPYAECGPDTVRCIVATELVSGAGPAAP
jgi:hypothetical protein